MKKTLFASIEFNPNQNEFLILPSSDDIFSGMACEWECFVAYLCERVSINTLDRFNRLVAMRSASGNRIKDASA